MSDISHESLPGPSGTEFVFEPDLLDPILTEDDDLVGFNNPWNPWSLVILTALTHFTIGGLFVALNQRRLGREGKFWSTWLTFLSVGAMTYSIWSVFILSGVQFTDNEERLWRHGTRAIALLLAFLFVRSQRRRFRVFTGGGGEPTSLFAWGIAGFVASLFVEYPLALVGGFIAYVIHRGFIG